MVFQIKGVPEQYAEECRVDTARYRTKPNSHLILWGDQIEEDETNGALVRLDKRYVYRILVGKPEGERLLGRPGR